MCGPVVPITVAEVEDKLLCWEKYRFDVLFSGDDWKGSERYRKTERQFARGGCPHRIPSLYPRHIHHRTEGKDRTTMTNRPTIMGRNAPRVFI